MDGNSMIDMYPKLAGQHATYLQKQLHDFRSAAQTGGKDGRMDPIMSGMAMGLRSGYSRHYCVFSAANPSG